MSEQAQAKHNKPHSDCKTQADPSLATTKGKANDRSGGEPQAAPDAAAKQTAPKKGCCG